MNEKKVNQIQDLPEQFRWYPLHLIERDGLEKIKKLYTEREAIRSTPRSASEAIAEVSRHGGDAVKELRKLMQQFQNREIESITPAMLMRAILAQFLTPELVTEATKGLAQHPDAKQRAIKIAALDAKIQKLITEIEATCWPKSRGNVNAGCFNDAWFEQIRSWDSATRRTGKKLDPTTNRPIEPDSPMERLAHYFGVGGDTKWTPFKTLQSLRRQKITPFCKAETEATHAGQSE